MMKNVLVTGASGFLGRHLTKRLTSLGYNIKISNTKIANLVNVDNLEIYNDIKFDYIFHLAAKTKAGDWCKYHKGEQWIDNQLINTNILKYWSETQPQAKLISFGTSCSYGPSDLPMKERAYMIYEPDRDLYTYAMTKRMLLIGCQSLADQYGLKYMHYIPSTLYGPLFDLEDSHFIFDLIKKITKGRYSEEGVELWGSGNQRRELVYIDDAIDIILSTMHMDNLAVNIGGGVDYSIRDYASIVSTIIGYPSEKINYNESKFVGVNRKILDIDKLLRLMPPDFTYTPLETGLQETINYYLKKIKND
jgi:GDP-L-fucose synthase